jgi:ribosomal protein L11 methyltransferase
MPEGFWTEVSLRVQPEACDDVSDLLQQLTGSGVTIEPPIEALGPDEGYILDEKEPLTLRGYLYGVVSPSARARIRRSLVAAGFGPSIAGMLHWRTIREEDWATAWKDHYHVEHAGNIAIRPAWRDYTPKKGELVVTLDPGMAFGTGQHPTTRMALIALQDLLPPDAHVLDLGAGSGVLAIAAIGLGARDAIAVDTEVQAYEACISNAALNGIEKQIRSVQGSLDDVAADGPYDLILANINAATVTRLAQGMYDVLKPGCYMVGGGIIEEREPGVVEALHATGFVIEKKLQEGDWRCLLCRRA